MHPARKRKLIMVSLLVLGVSIAVGFMLMALGENMNAFYSPTQVKEGEVPEGHTFRIGGMVADDSVFHDEKNLDVTFVVTDKLSHTTVKYTGILPDLFREGQGILAEGKLDESGVFIASRVLAKHDENYMPPEINEALKAAEEIKKESQNYDT